MLHSGTPQGPGRIQTPLPLSKQSRTRLTYKTRRSHQRPLSVSRILVGPKTSPSVHTFSMCVKELNVVICGWWWKIKSFRKRGHNSEVVTKSVPFSNVDDIFRNKLPSKETTFLESPDYTTLE